jgi:hypothetical protein
VTHPFHPLHGQEFEVVDRRRVKSGEDRLYLQVGPEQVVTVPAAWTTLGRPDPLVELAGGRSLFRVEDLVRLCGLVAECRASTGSEEEDDV